MKFIIHYSVGDTNDSYVLEGDTIEIIQALANTEKIKRGMDEVKNNMWSEEVA